MRFFIIAAGVTLALLQVGLDAAAGTPPADPSGSVGHASGEASTPDQASTSGSASFTVSPAPPAGLPHPVVGPHSDSDATAGSPVDASSEASHPGPAGAPTHAVGSPNGTPSDVQAPPIPPLASPVHAAGTPPVHGIVSAAVPRASATPPVPVSGDMSSGKCMCPPPPSCNTGPSPPSPTGINSTLNSVSPSSGSASDAISQDPLPVGTLPSPAVGSNDSQATSTAVNVFGQAGSFTGIIAAAAVVILY